MRREAKERVFWIFLFFFCLLSLVACPFIGSGEVDFRAIFTPSSHEPGAMIFWKLRVPRTFQAFLAGSSLSLGGVAFQALFRNPLATPFTLGVASGSSLGAVVALRLAVAGGLLGISFLSLGGFVGGLLAVSFVYAFSRTRYGLSTGALLLAGVAASFFFSSIILFLQYTADPFNSFRVLRWVVGGIRETVGFETALFLLPFTCLIFFLLSFLSLELNLLSVSEEIAASRGVAVERVKRFIFFGTSIAIAGVVSVCGPIGFVGLMVPHMCRIFLGGDHSSLIPSSFLLGGSFLVVCDTFSRTIVAPTQLPVGIVTAFLGGPFFLLLLLTKPRGSVTF